MDSSTAALRSSPEPSQAVSSATDTSTRAHSNDGAPDEGPRRRTSTRIDMEPLSTPAAADGSGPGRLGPLRKTSTKLSALLKPEKKGVCVCTARSFLFPFFVARTQKHDNGAVGKEPTYKASLLAIVKASWLNVGSFLASILCALELNVCLQVLLVFIPVSWALHFVGSTSDTVVFVMAFLAIIPLAKLLGKHTAGSAKEVLCA
jgi:hypothetical protein